MRIFTLVMVWAFWGQPTWASAPTALVDVTIVDTNSLGNSQADLDHATVLFRDGRIESILTSSQSIPDEYEQIAASGHFLLPGLIDAFGMMKSHPNFALAYLRAGVTTVVANDGGRRGALGIPRHSPRPDVLEIAPLGEMPATTASYLRQLDQLDPTMTPFLHLLYKIESAQLDSIIKAARRRGFRIVAELGHADPSHAVALGVDALVHSSRYGIELLTPEQREAYLIEPFATELTGPKWVAYGQLGDLVANQPAAVATLARRLTRGQTALIPTAALLAADRTRTNPWVSHLVTGLPAELIHCASNQATGARPWSPARSTAHQGLATMQDQFEEILMAAGARYVAGSGSNVWGTLPGLSLQQELHWLVARGLSPRQALATATGNFARAFRWPDRGHVAVGKRADLLLLSADPRHDLSALNSIALVVANGHVYRSADLQRGLHDSPQADPVDIPADELPGACVLD